MARMKAKEYTAAIRAPFWKKFGTKSAAANTVNSPVIAEDWAYDNTFEKRWRNAADTDDVRALSVDSDNKVYLAEAVAAAQRKTVTFYMDTAASITSQVFFIADRAYRIASISEVHRTANGTASTAQISKLTGTTAPTTGNGTMITETVSLTATAATVQAFTLPAAASATTNDSDDPALLLATGDRLLVNIVGTISALNGVCITVVLAPAGTGKSVVFNMKATADLAITAEYIFTANRPYIVTRVDAVSSTVSSVGGLTVTVTKDTSTNAPGAGTALLTTAIPLDGAVYGAASAVTTANTVINGLLTTTATTLRLAPGDRLSVKFSGGTVTALAGFVLQVTLQEQSPERKEVTFNIDHVPGQADITGLPATAFFIADRDYEVLDISEVHKTAAGAACKVTVTADTGTTAAGAGTILVTQNANAGFDLAATAATVQLATLPTTLGSRFLTAGDRLSIKAPSGTLTSCVGVQITASLAAR